MIGDGKVTPLPPRPTAPKLRPILIELKGFKVLPGGDVQYSWWAKVDRHPYSDKQGYPDPESASAAAEAWVAEHYSNREFIYEGDA